MSKSAWTWPIATLAFALSLAATGCSNSCDDLEEVCDGCPSELREECIQDKNYCTSAGVAVTGPVGDDWEDTCCENELDIWEGRC